MAEPKFSIIKDCKIGEGTIIKDFTNIYKAKIGKNSKIHSFVYIEEGVEIGDDVIIRPHTVITEKIIIGNNVFIGQGVQTINDLYPKTTIRAKVLKTIIKDNAVIGTGSIIFPVIVGKNSFVAAGSVVIKDVKDFSIVAGNPAKRIGTTKDKEFMRKQQIRDKGKDPRIKFKK